MRMRLIELAMLVVPALTIDARNVRSETVSATTAQLKVVVSPHGLIWVDGVMRGRTYLVVDVAAGAHTVEVVYFRGRTEKLVRNFKLDLKGGESRVVSVDFRSSNNGS
jgi:hypothetical protein